MLLLVFLILSHLPLLTLGLGILFADLVTFELINIKLLICHTDIILIK